MTTESLTTNPPSTASRRAFIRSATALAALGSMPAMATAGDDASLIELGRKYDVLEAECERLDAICTPLLMAVEDHLDATRPDTLRATDADFLIFRALPKPDPKTGVRWYEQTHIASITRLYPFLNAEGCHRIAEIEKAWMDHYVYRREEAFKEFGFIQPNERWWAKLEELDGIGREIMAVPARTVQGIAVKARLVLTHQVEGLTEAMVDEGPADWNVAVLAHLLKSIQEVANA